MDSIEGVNKSELQLPLWNYHDWVPAVNEQPFEFRSFRIKKFELMIWTRQRILVSNTEFVTSFSDYNAVNHLFADRQTQKKPTLDLLVCEPC